MVKTGYFVLKIIGSFLIFKNINKKINPRKALHNNNKKMLISEVNNLIRISCKVTVLIPISIKIIAFGVFSLTCIIYN